MKTKSWYSKLPLSEKIIIILFFSGFLFLVFGIIILLSINVDNDKNSFPINGFNFIYMKGVIGALQYNNIVSITMLLLLKTGIIFCVFLMPICSGTSIFWFIIKRLVF